jgi:hypothetical protein
VAVVAALLVVAAWLAVQMAAPGGAGANFS